MDTREMKGGYTTGSCATAGMKAALYALLKEERPTMVTVINPQDQPIVVPIKEVATISATEATATVVKDAFDKTPRNAPCPCGSGKKFKQCHGATNA